MRILIALQDWQVRLGLKRALRVTHSINDCGSLESFTRRIYANPYELLIVGETYEDGDVADLCKWARQGRHRAVPILLWSDNEDVLSQYKLSEDKLVTRVPDYRKHESMAAALKHLFPI